MATEAEANIESKAKLIAAKCELKTSESLLAAAEILNRYTSKKQFMQNSQYVNNYFYSK
jgi:hypothetical protein